jgi:hypothetical protein
MDRTKIAVALLALIAFVSIVGKGGAELRLALEDRADPNPRQMTLAMKLAGAAVQVAISWTDR